MKPTSIGRQLAALLLTLTLCGCAAELLPRHRKPEALAPQWSRITFDTPTFSVAAYLPPRAPVRQGLLTVYIEGDGLAYLGERTVSADPTPADPVALRLAARHPGGGAAYLARPCQYVMGRNCTPYYWTYGRFAPEVVEAMNSALTQLKAHAGAQRLVLAGYSGGGNIAILLAARRSDVVGIVTVAGNLDHKTWTSMENLHPLQGSLNAIDEVSQVGGLRQIHFAGTEDDVVPPAIPRAFVARLPPQNRDSLREVKGYNHSCCWADVWPELLPSARALADIPGWLMR